MIDLSCDFCEEEFYYKPLIPLPSYFLFDELKYQIPQIVPNKPNLICGDCLIELMESFIEC